MRLYKQFLFALLLTFSFSISAQTILLTLRQGVSADQATIQVASEMQTQDWVYVMPQPKSPKAAWGIRDGRTTWWVGYWVNESTSETSATKPMLIKGKYTGDNDGSRSWRRGGSPGTPAVIEWLLSQSGGIEPK